MYVRSRCAQQSRPAWSTITARERAGPQVRSGQVGATSKAAQRGVDWYARPLYGGGPLGARNFLRSPPSAA
eukprot:15432650-Alexandrium_andersonii.AAC.1